MKLKISARDAAKTFFSSGESNFAFRAASQFAQYSW